MSIERRKYMRFDALLDGAFHVKNTDIDGFFTMSNFSREGFRASLNREVEPGQLMECEMRFPNSIMPCFATGRIVWANEESSKELTARFNAGLKLERIDSLDRNRLAEYFYKSWYDAKKASSPRLSEIQE